MMLTLSPTREPLPLTGGHTPHEGTHQLDLFGALPTARGQVLDLFAGNGWAVAAQALGLTDHGVEINENAVQTRIAEQHSVVGRDVWTPHPALLNSMRAGEYEGLIASPPCQTFSTAGTGTGRKALNDVLAGLASGRWTDLDDLRRLGEEVKDERTALVLAPLFYAHHMMPTWIALEQVPAVLPVWEAMAEVLRTYGYHVWTGILNAEQYGVPQTRKRAILMAHADRPVSMPKPTHSKYHGRTPEKLDEGVLPWVSMADALGWNDDDLVGFARRADEQSYDRDEVLTIDGEDYRARDLRPGNHPAFALTEKARSWSRYPARWMVGAGVVGGGRPRPDTHPAPTITAKDTAQWISDPSMYRGAEAEDARNGVVRDKPAGWVLRNNSAEKAGVRSPGEPAPTVYYSERANYSAWEWHGEGEPTAGPEGDEHPTRKVHPGEDGPPQVAVRVTVDEASRLQSFPAGYRWQGARTAQFQGIGNAVPPLLGVAILRDLIAA